jgi:hypothetical protein
MKQSPIGQSRIEQAPGKRSIQWPSGLLLVLTVAAGLLLAGCQKANLPLEFEVETAISQSADFSRPQTVLLAREVRLKFGEMEIKNSYEDADYAEWLPMEIVFKDAGLVDIQVRNENILLVDEITHNLNVSLTAKGQTLSGEWQKDPRADDTDTRRTFIPGYTVPIARRRFVEVKRQTPLEGGRVRVEFTWRWEPTLSGKAFDVSDAAYQSLSPVARRCVDRFQKPAIDSGRVESGVAIFRLEKQLWRLEEFASPLL